MFLERSIDLRYWFWVVGLFILAGCGSGSLNPASATLPATPTVVQVTAAVPNTPSPVKIEIAADTPTPDPAIENGQSLAARVNGDPILLDNFEQEVARFAPGPDVAAQVLAALIDRQIVQQQARALAVDVSDSELNAAAQQVIESGGGSAQLNNWLAQNGLTESGFLAELRAQLVTQRLFDSVTQNTPATAEQVRLQYILATQQANAEALAARLAQNADFSALAQEIQNGSVKGRWQALDWFPRGAAQLPANVEEAAFKLQPGQISGPISAAGGYYIIKLEGKETGRTISKETLQILKIQAFTRWLQTQRAAATIQQFITLP